MYTGALAAISNRMAWQFTIEVKNPDTNDFVDFTGATINVAIKPEQQSRALLRGSIADGHVVVTGPGTADVTFPRSEIVTLEAGNYEVGITIKPAGALDDQLFAGTLPVVDGVVDP